MHPRGVAAAVRGEQLVRPHHPQHPRPRDPDPVQDEPRVDLPMALALERRAVEIGLNASSSVASDTVGVGPRRAGSSPLWPLLLACLPGVERRARRHTRWIP